MKKTKIAMKAMQALIKSGWGKGVSSSNVAKTAWEIADDMQHEASNRRL